MIVDEYMIDYERQKRTGVSEIIYGEGKNVEQIEHIIDDMFQHDQKEIFVSRVSQEKANVLKNIFPKFTYNELSKTFYWKEDETLINSGKIVVVCAGTSDLPVAMEAVDIARFLGNDVDLISDVGVAGIHRLFSKLDQIRHANVLVVVAGMEGALVSVIGGLVEAPIIAVPTSVGYGANFHGLSALLSMLNSCSNGVSVVNIDNGFGGGYMAHSINSLANKKSGIE
ncbi:nickel pincer cofactor biosynthesis protein LarB [Dubosiella newyorkensis]|uniref:nickel pincer cofactor biosynthesis protein LarB n=1 Tax=Dubosiella newyorkensis TaxID=1862672 RepID=UPI00272A153A|nr:nickel pincer cofactor biosynthesis protein LarB [Dubosiella newyorkensis]